MLCCLCSTCATLAGETNLVTTFHGFSSYRSEWNGGCIGIGKILLELGSNDDIFAMGSRVFRVCVRAELFTVSTAPQPLRDRFVCVYVEAMFSLGSVRFLSHNERECGGNGNDGDTLWARHLNITHSHSNVTSCESSCFAQRGRTHTQ